MKKTYIHPKITIVTLEVESLLAGSDRIPIDPNAGIPATNKRNDPWNYSNWSESE
jgi:hypothetical protein